MKRTALIVALLAVSPTALAKGEKGKEDIPPGEGIKAKDWGRKPTMGTGRYLLVLNLPNQGALGPGRIEGDLQRNGEKLWLVAGDLTFNGTDIQGQLKMSATYGKGTLTLDGSVATNGSANGVFASTGATDSKGDFTLFRTTKVQKKKADEGKDKEPAWKKWLCSVLPICL